MIEKEPYLLIVEERESLNTAETIVILGAGHFSLEVYHWAKNTGHNVIGFYENIAGPNISPTGLPIWRDLMHVPMGAVAILGTGSPSINKILFNSINGSHLKMRSDPTVIGGIVGGQNDIGDGLLLCPNAHVTSNAKVGRNVMANVGCIIGHYVEVGDFTCIAPYAVLAGSAKVGRGVYIGAGALIRQNVSIGDGAVIGMGAVVVKDVPAGMTVVGNPAVEMKKSGS